MKRYIRLLALLFVVIIDSCSAKKPEQINFVARTYSNETTEIVDHVIFEMIGKRYCYEMPDEYTLRTSIEFPEYTIESENSRVVRQYMQNRRMINNTTMIVVKNVLPSICRDSIYMKALKTTVDSAFRDDNTITFDGKTEEFWLSRRQKNIYKKLLSNMERSDLSVLEMVNTGCLRINEGNGKERQVPVNNINNKPEQYIDGYLTVSKAVVSDDGREACLLYEYVSGPKSGVGHIVFVEKVNNRWHLTREVSIWTS
jgi:hypothetical protein